MLAGLLCAGGIARGSAAPGGSADAGAQATGLFEQGKKLLAQGEVQGACVLFAESVGVRPYVGSLGALADCEERVGRLLAARGRWLEAVRLAEAAKDDRLRVVQERAHALEARIPRLTVRLSPNAPAGTKVTRRSGPNAVELSTLGSAELVDPGTYSIVVSAPGGQDRSYDVSLKESEQKVLDVEPGAPGGASQSETSPPAAGNKPVEVAGSGWSGWHTAGVVVGAVGIAGIVVGAIFGGTAISKKNDSASHCDENNLCDDEGITIRDDGIRAGNIATGLFVAGGVLAASGIVMLIAAPRTEEPGQTETALELGLRGLRVTTRW